MTGWVRRCAVLGALVCVLCGLGLVRTAQGIVINEFMASNAGILQDDEAQFDDWVELYNPSSQAVDVAGMFLTDDLGNPTKWQFPAGQPLLTRIPARGYLLLWADGSVTGSELHAGFALSADGEELGLYAADGTLIDSVVFGAQLSDVSCGRWPNGTGAWQYMARPTPLVGNVQGYLGMVEAVQASPGRGFYDSPVSVVLACQTPGAEIWYTLDSTTPHEKAGASWTGKRYTGPIQVSKTTCLRAVAVKTGWRDSAIISHTYLFLDEVIRQPDRPAGFPTSWGGRGADYAMDQRVVDDPAYSGEIRDDLKSTPSVCIVIPNADFFGPTGIYANPTQTGDAWERAASVEWIDPCTGDDFGVPAGLRIHGGPYSRSGNIKNALRVIFRGEYGLSKLEYPLFPDTEVQTFDTLALRSIWNYSWSGHSGMSGSRHADYLRDVFARDTIRDMGRLTPYGRPVQVYINGLYWGLYIMTERPDEDFAAQHLGGDEDDYDMLEAPSGMGASTTMDVVAGDEQLVRQAWDTLFATAEQVRGSAQAYQAIQTQIDVPTMIDYMLMVYYTGSRDAPVFLGDSRTPRNFYVVRRREPPSPFVVIPWDTEWALEEPTVNRVGVVGVWNPHLLMDRLAANPDFKMLLADHIHRQFHNGGALTREGATARYLARANEIHGAIVGESARWGEVPRPSSPYTREDWQAEVDRLVNEYFSGRTETVLAQLRARGWYPSVEAPGFRVNGKDQHGGAAPTGAMLTMTNPNPTGTIYYTTDGSDPRMSEDSQQAAQAVTLVKEDAPKKVWVPTQDIGTTWRGASKPFDDSTWTDGTPVTSVQTGGVGFETQSGYEAFITYDVHSAMYGQNASCYIRIPFTVTAKDLSTIQNLTLRARCDDGFVAFLNGVEVASVNRPATLAWNSSCVNRTDSTDFVDMVLTDGVSALRVGTNVLAVQALNQSTTSSDFLFSAELIGSSGGTGPKVSPGAMRYTGPVQLQSTVLVKARVLTNTWSAVSEALYAVGPVAQNLRISELMYHPAESGEPGEPSDLEFVELTNIGAQTINLALVRFTRGIEFTFPSLDLAPGQYVLVSGNAAAFEQTYGVGLPVAGQYAGSLGNAGERIRLEDALGQVILDFEYQDGWYGTTDGGGYSLVLRQPQTTPPDAFGDKASWTASPGIGGSPGRG